jgi:hypothetical protein
LTIAIFPSKEVSVRFRISLLAGLWAVVFAAEAELPPWVYKEKQDKAPEALVILVRSVKTRESREPTVKRTEAMIEAEVKKIERSATKLVPGAIIKIVYSRIEHSQPIVGPSEIPVLKEGQIYPAYLSHEGETYAPAAGGYSFETVR